MTRKFYCPICGQRIAVETDGQMPATFRLPDHAPAPGANLCAAYEIDVVFSMSKCGKCGRAMGKHPSGVCMDCYSDD